jgi:hypothetical protein
MTRRHLPQRANAKDHAIFLPSLLIDRQYRNAGSGTGQSVLMRRVASSRPRGDVEAKPLEGADMTESSSNLTACNSTSSGKKRAATSAAGTQGNFRIPVCFFQPMAAQQWQLPGWRRCQMSIGLIILIILIIALLGGFSGIGGGPFYGTGYYGGGGLGLIIVILLILLLLGRI